MLVQDFVMQKLSCVRNIADCYRHFGILHDSFLRFYKLESQNILLPEIHYVVVFWYSYLLITSIHL